MDIERIREAEFPVTKNLIYLNHAGVSPIPVRAATGGVKQLREYLSYGAYNPRGWKDISDRGRWLFAKLIGSSPEEVAFVKNTSEGISFIAGGFPWVEGTNVVTTTYEFPSNLYPWLALREKGVEVRMVAPEEGRVPAEKIFDAVDSNTTLISISSVEFINGFRHDLARVGDYCRKRDIYFFVDAIQSLGVIPMDVEEYNIDFLAADGHKWLLSIEGIGCLFVSRRVIDMIRPIEYGWHSVKGRFDFERIDFTLDETAKKFEPGSFNVLSIAVLNNSLELIHDLGVHALWKRIKELGDYLFRKIEPSWKVITPLAEMERSGIFTFIIPGVDPQALWKKLLEKKVVVSPRGGGIRVSPHFYNTFDEIDLFLERVRESIREIT
jgi:cysteine desulfurase/selenocysteine lyase